MRARGARTSRPRRTERALRLHARGIGAISQMANTSRRNSVQRAQDHRVSLEHSDRDGMRITGTLKEVKADVYCPRAIGVTFGGLLIDAVAPRPKPEAGLASDLSLLPAAPSLGHRGAQQMRARLSAGRARLPSSA